MQDDLQKICKEEQAHKLCSGWKGANNYGTCMFFLIENNYFVIIKG